MHDWRERVGEVRRFLTNRILIMGLVFIGAFCVLVAALFDAQIVNGHISVPVMRTHSRYIALSAPRGEIFDAFGRPLAVNLPVSVVKIDPSQIVPQPNEGLIFFMELMARHEQEISVDSEFLISETVPRYFSGSAANWRRWLRDFHIYDDLTAEEAYEALLEFFAICEYLPDAHTLLQLRAALHLHRFSHNQITLAWDIPEHTIMAIGENAARMAGIYVDQAFLRIYPEGRYTSHIVGWLGLIEAEQYQANRHLGYTATDLFGRAGAENAFEHQLRGTPGRIEIEVNSAGRRVATLSHQPPVAGNDIFLTICAHLQRYVYYALEDTLARVLLNRLNAQRGADQAEFVREVLASLVRSNNLPMRPVLDADEYYYPASFMLAGFVRGRPNLDPAAAGFIRAATDIIADGILGGQIHVLTIFDVLAEQEIISMSAAERSQLRSNALPPAVFLAQLIEARQITPQMANIEPSTASAVITCVDTGAVLAAVNYPTYDANQLTNNLNNAYLARISNDPTRPMINRAFAEARPPGSTFKMVTALAGLDSGIISPHTRLSCGGRFRAAGAPYLGCWIDAFGTTHGHLAVREAIAVSCNYFFNRLAFDMANPAQGNMISGIENLNMYMMALGLGIPTGVEINEMPMLTQCNTPRLPSPAYRAARGMTPWTPGEMSNVSIGQGMSNYTPAQMARVMATLANGGRLMEMHFLNRINGQNGETTPFVPRVVNQMQLSPAHIDIIHLGMYDVAFGARGTGRGIFAGFPMRVGVKSGTAEVDGDLPSHSTYGGFAPFDDPQIAVYVMIPHGDSDYLRGSAGHALRAIFEEYFRLNHRPASSRQTNSLAR